MGRRDVAQTVIGVLATLGMLLLASPGVRAQPARLEVSQPNQCSAGAPSQVDADLEGFLETLRREQLAGTVEGTRDMPVVLNGQGYNYARPSGIQLDSVMADALRNRQR